MAERSTRSVYPTLQYADPRAAVDWLVSTLGFAEHSVSTDADGNVGHAELTFGTGMIMLGPAKADTAATAKPEGVTPGVYLAVDDVDAHHDRAKAAGAEIIFPLTDQPYGSREYAVRDPEGHAWYLGTYRP